MAETKKIGFDLAAALGNVSSLDTAAGPDQIVYVDLTKLHEDPNNFYSLEGIEELASSIELVGLQQPPRVRPDPDRPGEYILISGHRRRAACQLLADEGKEQYKALPVIVEAAADSDALQELKLILANSETRKMTSAETARQAERIQELLYQLREQYGEELFPGRMRDYVAEACQISASRLARLKVIREKLIEELRPAYESGGLNETVAYAVAKHDPEWQLRFCRYRAAAKYSSDPGAWAEWHVRAGEKLFEKLDKLTCKHQADGGACDHKETLMVTAVGKGEYKNCSYGQCCAACSDLTSCKSACPRLAGLIAQKKAEAKEAKAEQKRLEAERERSRLERYLPYWKTLAAAIDRAGVDKKEVYQATNGHEPSAFTLKMFENNLETGTDQWLPYGTSMLSPADLEHVVATARLLGCSTDYLLGATEDPTPAQSQATPAAFIDAGAHPVPDHAGLYYCVFDCDGMVQRMVAEWTPHLSGWFFSSGARIDATVLRYYPLPGDGE